jgi:hypothetical protein
MISDRNQVFTYCTGRADLYTQLGCLRTAAHCDRGLTL